MVTLGKKLINLRYSHKLSQVEAADSIGVSQNAYARWEADKSNPIMKNLLKISRYYKIDLDVLVDDNKNINVSNTEISGGNDVLSINTLNIFQISEIIGPLRNTVESLLKLLILIEEQIKRN